MTVGSASGRARLSVVEEHDAPGAASERRGRLPAVLTRLVGRDQALRELLAELEHARLVTLSGPAGVGKTRMAIAAATAWQEQRHVRTWWVDLAQITNDGLLARSVADAIGIAGDSYGELVGAVAGEIGDDPALLALDNCEHLVDECAQLVHRLLSWCPNLKVLASSRRQLSVEPEVTWSVPPLSTPPAAASAPPAADFGAIELFLDRARRARPGFEPASDNLETIASICRSLDGLPLAIELAAARTRTLSIAQISSGLDDVFRLLVGGSRVAPERHRTLAAALEWSYQTLAARERRCFGRLSVFAGSFTLEAAKAVASGAGIDPDEVLDLLSGLVERSLVVFDASSDEARYALLTVVRQFGVARLAEARETGTAESSMIAWCDALASRQEPGLYGAGQARALAAIDAEVHNLRAALSVARARGEALHVLRLAGSIWRYWHLRGSYREGRDWLDWALAVARDPPPDQLAKGLWGAGALAFLQCEYGAARRRLEASLAAYRDLDDTSGIANVLQVLGSISREQGRYGEARRLHRESLTLFASLDDRRGAAAAHGYLGFVAWLEADFATARLACETALESFRALDDSEGMAWSLLSLGVIALYRGDHERAAELIGSSRRLSEQVGFREGIAWCLHELGVLALYRSDRTAVELLIGALEMHRELGDRWRTASVLEDMAAACVALGRPHEAGRLLGAALAIRESIGSPIAPCERANRDRSQLAVGAALSAEGLERALEQGRRDPIDDLARELVPAPSHPTPADAGEAGSGAGSEEPPSPPELGSTATAVDEAAARTGRPRRPVTSPAGEADRLVVRALGTSVVELGGRRLASSDWGYGKPRELLYLLATSAPLTRAQLGLALWPELDGQRLRNAMHTALRELRRALGERDWVLFANERYAFNRSRRYRCDVEEFDRSLLQARAARPPEAALPHLERAIESYQGDFLADLNAGEWAEQRRRELRSDYERALGAAGALLVKARRHREAVDVYRRAIAHEPLDEGAHRALMSSWAAMGQPGRALSHFEELCELLREQVGVDPAPATVALRSRIAGGAL